MEKPLELNYEDRVTPENITVLAYRQIFVFGSNLAGKHGAGAAKLANLEGWAVWGKGCGVHLLGKFGSFAIPTKGLYIETIPLDWIKYYVDYFIEYAKAFPELTFLVTEIGCGLAGYQPEQIAPMFKDVVELPNVKLPQRFWDILSPKPAQDDFSTR